MGSLKPVSPVAQDFIWVAEYADKTYLAEYDFNTGKENSFYNIQKDKLIRFGLIGRNNKFYFEVFGGVFKLNGIIFDFIYRTKEKDYRLIGWPHRYTDIITYKDAETYFLPDSMRNGSPPVGGRITQYNLGYKALLNIAGVSFNFRPIICVSAKGLCLNLRLVADAALNGKLLVLRNNQVMKEIEAPLKKGVGGEVNILL